MRLIAPSADRLLLSGPRLLQPFHDVLRRVPRPYFGRCSGLLDIVLCDVPIITVAIIGCVAPATQPHRGLFLLALFALSVPPGPRATVTQEHVLCHETAVREADHDVVVMGTPSMAPV